MLRWSRQNAKKIETDKMPNDNKKSLDKMPTNHLAFCPHTMNSRLVDFKKLLNFQNRMKKVSPDASC